MKIEYILIAALVFSGFVFLALAWDMFSNL